MTKNIYKKKNQIVAITGMVIVNILLAFVITIVCGFAFGFKFLNIVTGSMTPTMPVGTIVVVKNIPFKQLEVGDVITYKTSGGSNVTHRIIEKSGSGNSVWTKGDAADGKDQYPVTEKNFVGVVVYHVKGLGYVFDIIKENIIMITVGVVLALFIVTYS